MNVRSGCIEVEEETGDHRSIVSRSPSEPVLKIERRDIKEKGTSWRMPTYSVRFREGIESLGSKGPSVCLCFDCLSGKLEGFLPPVREAECGDIAERASQLELDPGSAGEWMP